MKLSRQFFLFFLGTVFLLFQIFSCGGSKNTPIDAGSSVREASLPFLIENVKSNPNDPDVRLQLARAYYEIDSLDLALLSVDKVLELDETSNAAKMLRADIFLAQLQVKKAYSEYLGILISPTGDEYVETIRKKIGNPYPIRQLTRGDFNNAFPCFSPDNNRIVFQSDRDSNWEIYLMDADGTQEVRLTNNFEQDEMPVFSAKEDIVAFTSTRADSLQKSRMAKNRNIFLMDLKTGNVACEIDDEADDWYPGLSSDAREMVFVSERDDQRDVSFQEKIGDIYLKEIRSGEVLRMTQNERDDSSPSFSADGKWIVYTSNPEKTFQIFKMNNKGTIIEQLTFLNGNCGSPHFSPDDQKITFFADMFGNFDVYEMDSKGENIVRLTNDPNQDAYPSYSSEKRKIVFHSNRSGKYQIYVIDLMNPLMHDELIEELEIAINSLKYQ